MEKVLLTPEMASRLLEHNTLNRPLSALHVQRIASQIVDGKWKFNGDTIKVSCGGDVLDGQHRCWAVMEAKMPIETIIVHGIESDAFTTIDTIRKSRSGSDTLTLCGAARQRKALASALAWLLRWQREVLETYRAPLNRIENSDIEESFHSHPNMIQAVERASRLRRLANPGIMAFLYYIISNRNPEIAERMINSLENPAGIGINDPFFRLRAYFTADMGTGNKDPLMTIALVIKAANFAAQNREIAVLRWNCAGKSAEEFPQLDIGRPHDAKKKA